MLSGYPGGGQGRPGRRPGAAVAAEAALDRHGGRGLRARGTDQLGPVRRHDLRGGAGCLGRAPRRSPSAGPAAAAAAATVAPALIAPFDAATVLGATCWTCARGGPSPRATRRPGRGPLPDVPALLVEGADDLRTPLETARRAGAGLPARAGGQRGRRGPLAGLGRAAAPRAWPPASSPAAAVRGACRDARAPAPTGVPPRSLKGLSPLAAVGRDDRRRGRRRGLRRRARPGVGLRRPLHAGPRTCA